MLLQGATTDHESWVSSMVPSQGVKEAAEAEVHLLTEVLAAIKTN